MVKAIIFDMDGVIVDSEHPRFEILTRLLAEKDIQVKPEHYPSLIGTKTIIWLKNNFGAFLSDEEISLLHKQRKEEVYRDLNKYTIPEPGIIELVKQFSPDYKLAVASAADIQDIEPVLKTLGIRENFSVISGFGPGINPKPAPDIYLNAIDSLQLTADQCVAIEDSPAGVKAAKAAGLICITVTHTTAAPELAAAGADFIVEKLLDIPLVLSKINAQQKKLKQPV